MSRECSNKVFGCDRRYTGDADMCPVCTAKLAQGEDIHKAYLRNRCVDTHSRGKTMVTHECLECGGVFVSRWSKARYCSRRCSSKATSRVREVYEGKRGCGWQERRVL